VAFFADTIANKLHLQKVNDFVLSPGAQPTKVLLKFPIFFLGFLQRITAILVQCTSSE